LPVVVVRRENEGAASAAVAWCSGGSRPVPVESFDQLNELLEKWDGRMPTAAERASAERLAAKQAKRLLEERHQSEFGVEESVREGLIDAAKERLRVEVALTLACIAQPGERFDQAWYRRMSGRTTDGTLNKAHGLIGYLSLSAADELRYREIVEGWSKAKRDARNTLSDIKNALEDWRWGVGGNLMCAPQ